MKTSVRNAALLAEIWNRELLNTNQECHALNRKVSCKMPNYISRLYIVLCIRAFWTAKCIGTFQEYTSLLHLSKWN
jgi:hypothetical protein